MAARCLAAPLAADAKGAEHEAAVALEAGAPISPLKWQNLKLPLTR